MWLQVRVIWQVEATQLCARDSEMQAAKCRAFARKPVMRLVPMADDVVGERHVAKLQRVHRRPPVTWLKGIGAYLTVKSALRAILPRHRPLPIGRGAVFAFSSGQQPC
jgi:hypothetical protein